ncbi:hypothetical protein [Flavobacterium sp.]|uniref:hypothetical protein n=1 Tax=Flavobacterium sp. TaxID=239 RepID=UPI003C3DB8F8
MDITLNTILLSSILATIVMTTFSYLMSTTFNELYKEPVLLTYFLNKFNLKISFQLKNILAWLLHFVIGYIFVLSYHFLWTYTILNLSVLNGILFGAVSGLLGILGWVSIFEYTQYQPKIDFNGYFIQLFFAHVIFGLVAYIVYSQI